VCTELRKRSDGDLFSRSDLLNNDFLSDSLGVIEMVMSSVLGAILAVSVLIRACPVILGPWTDSHSGLCSSDACVASCDL